MEAQAIWLHLLKWKSHSKTVLRPNSNKGTPVALGGVGGEVEEALPELAAGQGLERHEGKVAPQDCAGNQPDCHCQPQAARHQQALQQACHVHSTA